VVGVHGVARIEDKREGDGKSPAGRFPLAIAYGYAAAPPPGTRLPYTTTDASWQCVDDADSRYYARVLDRRTVAPDWRSAEDMHRGDELYRWVIDTGYNPEHKRGRGSCIFLHVWAGPESTTVGCTAMAQPELVRLLSHLEPGATFVLLPRDEYRALAGAWSLPPQ
jgi:L,D-peptidoglycan transpeptidase YkuD (ErfK/YbiS/YcfS/YnhG family)